MILRVFGLALLAAPLAAQGAMQQAHESKEIPPAPATLILLDAKGSSTLRDAFAELMRRPELRDFEVPLRTTTLGSGGERTFLARYGLKPKAQWALVKRRAVLAQGDAPPDADRFLRELQAAGFRDLVKELGAFLRQNPDRLDARDQLLALLRSRAERTAERRREATVPENPVQDLDAWGAFAQELDSAFRTGQWRELDLPWLRSAKPLDGDSPTLRVVYHRWMPTVEAALQRHPESDPLWTLWLWMERAVDSGRLPALLATLHPGPLATEDQWPPEGVTQALLRGAKRPQDWRALRDLLLARWMALPRTLRERAGDPQSPLLDQEWTGILAPLLECCLRAGDTGQADALFVETLGSRWAELPSRGAALARRCGQPQLASRWAGLPLGR